MTQRNNWYNNNNEITWLLILFPDSDDLCQDELSTTPKSDSGIGMIGGRGGGSMEKEEKEMLLQQRKAEAQIRRRKKKKTNSSLAASTFKVSHSGSL